MNGSKPVRTRIERLSLIDSWLPFTDVVAITASCPLGLAFLYTLFSENRVLFAEAMRNPALACIALWLVSLLLRLYAYFATKRQRDKGIAANIAVIALLAFGLLSYQLATLAS
jgi:hypothetical protein